MLSVLIETRGNEEALARTLSSLIGGAVAGTVREVIVCDLGSTDQTRQVADQTGCHFLAEGGIAAGIAQAKSDWLLLLEPGARLDDGWADAVEHYMEMMAMPARFTRSKADKAPLFKRLFARRRALAEGLLIRKAQAYPLSRRATNAEALAHGLAAKRLRAEIRVAMPG
jgi:glycosyltransferase involved in cell wall biosynthesis